MALINGIKKRKLSKIKTVESKRRGRDGCNTVGGTDVIYIWMLHHGMEYVIAP